MARNMPVKNTTALNVTSMRGIQSILRAPWAGGYMFRIAAGSGVGIMLAFM